MSVFRRLLLIPPVLTGVGILYFATSSRDAPEKVLPTETATVARYVVAKPRPLVPRVIGYGTVEPARTWNAIAQVGGRVIEVNPDFVKGGFVGGGDVLVRLATEDYELEIAQAEADIEAVEADIQQLKQTETTTRQSLEIEQQVLKLEQAELERQRELLDRGVSTPSNIEEQQSAILKQQASIQSYQSELALIPSKLKSAEQSKARAQAVLDIARLNLARTVIRAPYDARVADVDVEIDQYIAAGSVMGELDGIDAAEIEVQVPPRQMKGLADIVFDTDFIVQSLGGIAEMQTGLSRLSAEVRLGFADLGLAGSDVSWDADVIRISDTMDPETRSVGVIVSVKTPYADALRNSRPPLVKGMFVEVEIEAPRVDRYIVLPRGAVTNAKVLTIDGDRLSSAEVRVLHRMEDIVVVESGLEPGTRVVISDLSPTIPGMLLDPVEDARATAELIALADPHAAAAGAAAEEDAAAGADDGVAGQ